MDGWWDLTERMTTERDKAMRNPTHWNRSVLDAFVLDNVNALVKSAADQSVNFRLAGPEQEVILSPPPRRQPCSGKDDLVGADGPEHQATSGNRSFL